MSDRELWQNALVQIELGTSEASFRTWFKGTEILRRDGNDVQISVPSKIVKEWLREKHHKLILKHYVILIIQFAQLITSSTKTSAPLLAEKGLLRQITP